MTTTHDEAVHRFRHSLGYMDALNRWLEYHAAVDPARVGWRKVEDVYEASPDFVDDVETYRIVNADRWVEAEAVADEPRVQSSFEDDRRYEWDD